MTNDTALTTSRSMEIPFSCRSLWIYDDNADQNFSLQVTPAHIAQCFTSNNDTAYSFHPRLQDGRAEVAINVGQLPEVRYLQDQGFTSATSLPLSVTSGSIRIDGGPGEEDSGLKIDLPNGRYRMIIAEAPLAEDRVKISIFLSLVTSPQPTETPATTFIIWDPSFGQAHPPTTLAPKAEEIGLS